MSVCEHDEIFLRTEPTITLKRTEDGEYTMESIKFDLKEPQYEGMCRDCGAGITLPVAEVKKAIVLKFILLFN